MNNRRGQIGETMTWVVATIVIIVILGISIFIVKFSLNEKEFVKFSSEDSVLTKSAVSFLRYGNNFDELKNAIEKDDYNSIKPKIEKFFKGISEEAWDFRIFVNDKLEGDSVVANNLPGLSENKKSYFQFNLDSDEIGLSFSGGKNE